MDLEPSNSRYTSRVQATTRQTAQFLLLKPALSRLLKIHVHGLANLDGLEGAFAVFGNHSSHLDAPLILCSLPNRLSRYVATGAAGDFFFGNWVKAISMSLFMNAFAIDRGKGGKGRRGMAGQLLSDGVPILLFPEGTRSRTGAMAPFKSGVAALGIQHSVPILPMALVGAYAAMPYGQNLPVPGRPPVHIVFGVPQRALPGETVPHFKDRLYNYVVELHDSTARAYGMPTQEDFHRSVALKAAAKRAQAALESGKDEDADIPNR